jgi:hypothetical protein
LPEGKISEKEIRKIARTYETHPAIVLGRLYKLGRLHASFGVDMKLKVILDQVIYKNKECYVKH